MVGRGGGRVRRRRAGVGCWNDVELPSSNAGSLGGRVLLSGGVRGARVSADQLDLRTGEVRFHVGDAVTDEAGRFAIPTGTENGLVRVRALGGSFEDLATGATIDLDDTDAITSLVWYELLDLGEDALVSPIGHLIEARTMARLPALGDLTAAFAETAASFHAHFGDVDWGAVIPAPLDRPANSPVEAVRAAFVHAALSVLARDLASGSEAGPQEVNVYRLMLRWAADVREGTFDGNDGDDRAAGSGLQLGFCPPVDPACVVPATGCTTGHCRTLCDLYSGTPRALLAGAMLKVISDSGPGGINQTGLGVSNTLSVARAVSDNADPNLFAAPCVETLDRLPPLLSFEPPTPGGAGFVRGAILVRAAAVDDTDLSPDTSLVGLPDLDGDPHNAVALATIDTAALADGPLTVVARATDLSGNSATLELDLVIDNTAPVFTLDPAGFFIDGNTWWTASATPVLAGTITDLSPVSIKAVFPGGIEAVGTVTGASWTILLPPGVLDDTGTPVLIVATDAVGNESRLTQRIRPDVEAPVLSFQPSVVTDEAAEPVWYLADHGPQHAHTGQPIDLAAAGGCPSLTKFSYLLGSATPEYVIEAPGPNPLRYQLITDDPGVGIAAGSTEYRVGRRSGASTTWLLDWASAGAGVPVGAGVTRFPVGVSSDAVPDLATTEGVYDVELRATDRLGRTTTAARCFDLRLRAPPLDFELTSGARPTKDHAYALDSLSLAPGAPYDQIAARLLNPDATGASLIDQDVWNGTPATVYLTVTVTPPSAVMVAQSFVLGDATTAVTAATCGSNCPPPSMLGPVYVSPTPAVSVGETHLQYPVKVFEVVGGEPVTELPCVAPCPPSGSVFTFAIPPRATGGQPARWFRVMTMIGQISSLWPQDSVHPTSPPFADEDLTWTSLSGVTTTTRFTGVADRSVVPERTGCVKYTPGPAPVCSQQGTIVPYRALRSATLTFASVTESQYATAATATLTPVQAAPVKQRPNSQSNDWTTSEGVLP